MFNINFTETPTLFDAINSKLCTDVFYVFRNSELVIDKNLSTLNVDNKLINSQHVSL